MSNMDNHDDLGEDLARQSGDAVKKGAKAAGKKAGRKMTAAVGKKVLGGVAKAGAAALAKTASLIASVAGPVLLIIIVILLVVAIGWYILFEIRGKDQDYSMEKLHENELVLQEERYLTEVSELSSENKAITNFYDHIAKDAYWQVIEPEDDPGFKYLDKEDPMAPIRPHPEVRDYYNQEELYKVNGNFLFMMDEDVHRGAFRYPEQFVNPVHFDREKMKQLPLMDPFPVVESRVFDEEKNVFLEDEKEISVHDWGIGSIFRYKKDKIERTLEGTYTKEDYYDEGCGCVKQKSINIPYKENMPGYPKDIWIIKDVVTFSQDVELVYEYEKEPVGTLSEGSSTDPTSMATKIYIGTQAVYETRTREVEDPENPGEMITETYREHVKDVALYRHRNGEVYETKPVPQPDQFVETKHGVDYIQDYAHIYRSWVPLSVMEGFDFEERMGGDIIDIGNLELGSSIDSGNFKRAMQYFDIAKKWGDVYGVDPYVIIAIISQESGGNPKVNADGLMQIARVGGEPRAVTALNPSTGKKDTFYINGLERQDPEKAIHWGVMYFKSKMDAYDSNPIKALQSYNFDVSGYMKKTYPDAWNDPANSWLQFREEARLSIAPGTYSASYDCAPELEKSGSYRFGDICYIEHVLRYYGGDQLTGFNGGGNATPPTDGEETAPEKEEEGNFFEDVVDAIKSIFQKKYEEDEPRRLFEHSMDKVQVDDMLKGASTFDKEILFSEAKDSDDPAFWEEGFNAAESSPPGLGYGDFIDMAPSAAGYITPLDVPNPRVTSCFGPRVNPVTGKFQSLHAGTDVGVPAGTPQYAIADGRVIRRATHSGWGNYVKIQFKDGNTGLYAHLSSFLVQQGQEVKQGQAIGLTGSTGRSTSPHLHFEFEANGKLIDSYYIVVGKETPVSCKATLGK